MSALRNRSFIWAAAAALGVGALLAALDGSLQQSASHFLIGWLVYSLFAGLGLASYFGARRLFDVPDSVKAAALTAWALRITVGVLLMLLLPVFGNPNEPSQAGYLFDDAFRRDTQAWELAQSGLPLGQAFSGSYSGDQYGGVLALYAAVYRIFSPDLHRPFLILLLGAAAAVWGVMALGAAVKHWFDAPQAGLAAWILALYPEALFLSASHMREALVIPLTAVAWFGLIPLQNKGRAGWLTLTAALALLLLIQPAVAIFVIITLAGLWVLEFGVRISWRRLVLLGVLLAAALAIVFSVWANLPSLQGSRGLDVIINLLSSNFNIQVTQTSRQSGMIQRLLDDFGQQSVNLMITTYGVFRPVLPAALFSSGVGIMRFIESWRGLGWYLLAPLMLYGVWMVFRPGLNPGLYFNYRKQLRWLALVIWVWAVIASANAGGDQWDNPRYRAMFLVFQAVFAAWTWFAVKQSHDRWFWRFAAMVAAFVALFTIWYITRAYAAVPDVHIYVIITALAVICAAIVLFGIWSDRKL